jgi:autophagy-related protein 9
MSGLSNALIWIFAFLWVAKLFQYLYDIRRLKRMHDFYLYLLEVPDTDIQTVSWQDVVKRLMALRDSNPTTSGKISEQGRRYIKSQSKQRMDAHDIANRLMRRDNYLIALFNKDILDVTLPVPFLANRQFFSKTLEWNLSFCILDYVFNEKGQVRPVFLKESQRRILSDGLRRRFLFAGIMNVICAPFIIIYLVLLYFFRYFSEYQKNPSQIGSRQYTPLAEWKFREFNELWHLFERRINMSYPFASRYLDQFPKDKLVQIARFIAFVTGALISVLALASVFDPDLFLGFEISPDRTVLFYLTLFTSIWAAVRAIIPEENLVFDPEYALNNVIDYTHYCPAPWRGRLHSDEVRKEFARLYRMKLIIFLGEVFSIITTPFVLWFSLPNCSDQLVDFFREFTVHVDGLGYVCSFAVFDFQKGGNNVAQQPQPPRGTEGQDLRDEYYSARDGKMLASYYNFLDNYATNPKAGAPYHRPPRKAQFHPPPVFPGLQSTNLTVDGHPSGAGGRSENWDRHQRISSRHGFGGPASASQRTPRFPPVASQPSPITSILLDPQHQPAVSSIRAAHRPGIQSRLRASRRPPTDVIEDDEDAFVEQDISNTSRGGPADSFLDDSWKTTRPDANDEDDEADGGVPTNAADKSPGVLGLVYQFSKAQTEGRGAGVHI